MTEKNVEVVRQPIAVRARPHRSLEERIALRFPRLRAALLATLWRLPPRSRLRQACLRRAVQLTFEATNRRDYEVTFTLYDPDGELTTPPQLVGLGFDPMYRGREDRVGFQRRWVAEWGEFRLDPEEVIDLGDRVLLLGRTQGTGHSSRATVASDWANLLAISPGRVTHEQVFFDRAEALEAAGLSE